MPPLRLLLVALPVLLSACGSVAGSDAATTTSSTVAGSDTIRPELTGVDDAVLVLGDSLTVGATDLGDLEVRLHDAGFDEVDVIAEQGRDAEWGLEQIEALASVPALVVVELGTNRSANPEGFAEAVDRIVAALRARGAARVAWITPTFATDDRYRDKIDIIEAAAGIDVVGDWDEVVHADPSIMGGDGLHPTEPGYGLLAGFLADTAADLASS